MWSFVLETAEGETVLSAEDVDFGDLNRLTLWAAVRGLESIDGPSSVMLLSNNRYLIRSLSESLPRWRENQFVWEHFGRRIDVQHADLWRRIDRALQIHRVQACLISSRLVSGGTETTRAPSGQRSWLRVDAAHDALPAPAQASIAPAQASPAPALAGPTRGAAASRVNRDGLRRWLLEGGANESSRAPRHRFTTADLLESV
jgi:ribonuclease HI